MYGSTGMENVMNMDRVHMIGLCLSNDIDVSLIGFAK